MDEAAICRQIRVELLRPYFQLASVWPDSLEAAVEREKTILRITSKKPPDFTLKAETTSGGFRQSIQYYPNLPLEILISIKALNDAMVEIARSNDRPPCLRESLMYWSNRDFGLVKELVRLFPRVFLFTTPLRMAENNDPEFSKEKNKELEQERQNSLSLMNEGELEQLSLEETDISCWSTPDHLHKVTSLAMIGREDLSPIPTVAFGPIGKPKRLARTVSPHYVGSNKSQRGDKALMSQPMSRAFSRNDTTMEVGGVTVPQYKPFRDPPTYNITFRLTSEDLYRWNNPIKKYSYRSPFPKRPYPHRMMQHILPIIHPFPTKINTKIGKPIRYAPGWYH